MVVLPGELISALTFPGVICHEYAHVLACRWRNVRVLDTTYFQLGESPSGYVRHQTPTDHSDAFWLATAPFFVNTITAALAVLLTTIVVTLLPQNAEIYAIAGGFWFGGSIAMHAFPSPSDAKTLWSLTKYEWRGSLFAALTVPVVAAIYLGHYLSYINLDFVYGAAVVFLTMTTISELANSGLLAVVL